MVVILSGVSGAGKDTIRKELMKKMDNAITIPSYTDREIRKDDVPGVSYNFVSKEEFERMIKDNELYEYNVYNNHYYGTSKKVLNEANETGKIILKDIDVNGTEKLVELLKNDMKVVTIFLKVEREELRNRLKNRIDQLDDKEIEQRLDRMEYEESKI